MAKSNFLRDLKRGGGAERLVIDLFNRAGFPSKKDNSVRTPWDIISTHGDDIIKTEVKFDEYEQRSGNVAIEVFNPRLQKPSGLTATEAFFWAHVLADGVIWITPTELLKKYLDQTEPARIIDRGGDNNATLYLYPSAEILSEAFYRVDDMPVKKFRPFVIQQWSELHE